MKKRFVIQGVSLLENFVYKWKAPSGDLPKGFKVGNNLFWKDKK